MTKPNTSVTTTLPQEQINQDSLTLLLLEQWRDLLTKFTSESLLDPVVADNAQMIFWHLFRAQRQWFTAWLNGYRINQVDTCELITYYYSGVARMKGLHDPKVDVQIQLIRDTYETKPNLSDVEFLVRLQYGIDELNKFLTDTGVQYPVLHWSRVVRYINMLLRDTIETILPCKTLPVWCANVEQLLLVYKQACERRVNEPRVPLLIPIMQSITNQTRTYSAFVNNLSNGLTTMTDTKPTAIAMTADDVVSEVPARVIPTANLRKDPAYQLSINGCGRVAMRFTGSRLGWVNDISMHIDIAADNLSVRDDVVDVLSTVEFLPFENHSAYENDAALAQEQLTKFIAELRALSVLERPEYSAEICFISIVPTVRQSWATDGHGNPV